MKSILTFVATHRELVLLVVLGFLATFLARWTTYLAHLRNVSADRNIGLAQTVSLVTWQYVFLRLLGWQAASGLMILVVIFIINVVFTDYYTYFLRNWKDYARSVTALGAVLSAVLLYMVLRAPYEQFPLYQKQIGVIQRGLPLWALIGYCGLITVEIYSIVVLRAMPLAPEDFEGLFGQAQEVLKQAESTITTPAELPWILGFLQRALLRLQRFIFSVLEMYLFMGGAFLEGLADGVLAVLHRLRMLLWHFFRRR